MTYMVVVKGTPPPDLARQIAKAHAESIFRRPVSQRSKALVATSNVVRPKKG